MNANPISTVGLMLTLAGLVGSFFNIQLSQWLRDLMALDQKVRLNQSHSTEATQRAIVECRIEYRRLGNLQSFIISILVLLFVAFVLVNGLFMVEAASADPLYSNVTLALWLFLIFFVLISCWLLGSGWKAAASIKKTLAGIR